MKRLIDKLKQQRSISLGTLALTLVSTAALVLLFSVFNLSSVSFKQQPVWAVIQAAFITGCLGAGLAAVGYWGDIQAEKCENALLVFVIVFLLWVTAPGFMPAS